MNRFSGRRTGAKTASGGLGSGRTGTGSRVGRSIAGVWDVTTTAFETARRRRRRVGSRGRGVARLLDRIASRRRRRNRRADFRRARRRGRAKVGDRDERTRGADLFVHSALGAAPPDDELDPPTEKTLTKTPIRTRFVTVRDACAGMVSSAARRVFPPTRRRLACSRALATVVAARTRRWRGGGGIRANGRFRGVAPGHWGVVTRAAAGGWGEGGAGDDNAVTFTADGAAFTALGFLTESAAARAPPAPTTHDRARGRGTRGGGGRRVGRRHGRVRAFQLAAPGSSTPAWSLSREPRGSPRLDPLLPGPPHSGGSACPSLALTASSAPEAGGSVRLWDVRRGPREAAAASGPRGRGHGDEPRRGERRGGALRR